MSSIVYKIWLFFILYNYVYSVHNKKTKWSKKKIDGRIVRGVDIGIDQFPWLAQVTMYDQTYCGGSVISDRVILTAAHCIISNGIQIDPEDLAIYLGSSYAFKGKKYECCKVLPHEKYNDSGKDYYFYDIGLMLLKTRISFGQRVKKATILPPNKTFREEQFTMSVAGWGYTDSYGALANKLQMTRMRYVSNKRCNNSQTSDSMPMPVPAHMFCMVADKWTSDCYGDSGSGVVWGNYLIGVVATGRDVACGSETMPSMYTSVPYFRQWIIKHVQLLETRAIGTCSKQNTKLGLKNKFGEKRKHNEVVHNTGDMSDDWLGLSLMPRIGRTDNTSYHWLGLNLMPRIV